MNKIQNIANYCILNHAFTIGIGDTVADKNTMNEVKLNYR